MNANSTPNTLPIKKKRLTLSGKIATGTSSVLRELKSALGDKWQICSAGDAMRALAKERGVDFYDFVFNLPDDADDIVDAGVKRLLQSDYTIAEGRCSHGFAPREYAITVLLDAPEDIRLERYFNREVKKYPTLTREQALETMHKRDALDVDRYKKVTKTDEYIYDPKHFDIIIDSGICSVDEIVREILNLIES